MANRTQQQQQQQRKYAWRDTPGGGNVGGSLLLVVALCGRAAATTCQQCINQQSVGLAPRLPTCGKHEGRGAAAVLDGAGRGAVQL
jgi:hypothetical protein